MALSGTRAFSVSYRCLEGALPPRRISVPHPGWGGEADHRSDGATAQPWHCAPFTEGASYGLELIYPFETRCEVILENGRPRFNGDFHNENKRSVVWPPFQSANPRHYSLATLLDVRVPDGQELRIEPHPSFFTDASGSVPAAVIGNVQTSWWPLCLFVTFKSPRPGEMHVFKQGTPYCQLIVVPGDRPVTANAMDAAEAAEREIISQAIMKSRAAIASRDWVSAEGLRFDDVYKQLRRAYLAGGEESVIQAIAAAHSIGARR